MENINLSPGWQKLYDLNFPSSGSSITPVVTPPVSEPLQSVAVSPPSPSSSSGDSNVRMKIIVAAAIIGIICIGYNIYKSYRAEKENS
jgi:hypothetical protein